MQDQGDDQQTLVLLKQSASLTFEENSSYLGRVFLRQGDYTQAVKELQGCLAVYRKQRAIE